MYVISTYCCDRHCYLTVYVVAFCPAEVDTLPGAQLSWPDTPAGSTAIQPCPQGADGDVHRSCDRDDMLSTGAKWADPVISYCTNSYTSNFYNEVNCCMYVQVMMTTHTSIHIWKKQISREYIWTTHNWAFKIISLDFLCNSKCPCKSKSE